MQRYYFEIKIDGAVIVDDTGRDCRDLADAHAHAAKIVADCVRFCPPEPMAARGRIAVVDAAGRRLLTVLFPSVDRLRRRAAQRTKGRIRGRIKRQADGCAGAAGRR